MRRCLVLAVCILALTSVVGAAAPVDPALQQQLLALYGRYVKAAAAGKVNDALALRTASERKRLQPLLRNRKERDELVAFFRFMAFDKLDVVHSRLAKSGNEASLLAIATKTMPANYRPPPGGPAPGSTARLELTLDFVREKAGWRFENQTFGGDPDKITPCPDDSFEPIDAYDTDRDVNLGGPIRRVEFRDDHTLVVVRVLDAENCAYLPDRGTLEARGFNPAHLVPYTIVTIEGAPHRSDGQKVWIGNLSVAAD